MTAVSVARGYDDTIIMKHKIKRQVVNKSLTVVFIGFLAVLLASGVIIYTTHDGGVTASTVDALFESPRRLLPWACHPALLRSAIYLLSCF